MILENKKKQNYKTSIINNIKFISIISIINSSTNILGTYQRNFFIPNSISQINSKLKENIHLIPNFIKYICKIIEILLIKKNNNIKKILIYKYIGKFFFIIIKYNIIIT